jgi:hypothetical protein
MIKLVRKKQFDPSQLETGDCCLGYDEIEVLFNMGPFPGGGHCIIVRADGENTYFNSNDLIHDLDAYDIVRD